MNQGTHSATDRRAVLIAQIKEETSIDEDMIERLVHGFYARVREDDVIGPIFNAKIKDWEPHLERMCEFWSSVALMSGRYHGQPMIKHLPLPIDGRHFDRWLALFEAAAQALCPPNAAAHFIQLARRIGESLELGIASAQGVLLRKGERYLADEQSDDDVAGREQRPLDVPDTFTAVRRES